MNKKVLKCTAVFSSALIAVVGGGALVRTQSAAEESPPLTLQLSEEVHGTGADYLEIDLGELNITGTHIGIKINPVYAVDQNGNHPIWSMFYFIFTDADGKSYTTYNYNNVATTLPGATVDGAATSITWMYSYLWPLQGFYGTMYLPWALLNGGTEENPTQAPSEITKIRIQHNSTYTSARREMLAHFFTLTDAVVNETEEEQTFGDVKILETFETQQLDVQETVIYSFADTDLNSVVWSSNKAMDARFATEEETDAINELAKNASLDSWKSKFTVSGQHFTYMPEESPYGNALKWEYGSYYDEYDSSLNSYGSLTIPLTGSKRDFSGAKGLTLWVKNPQSYPISFNLEFAESENGGAERWNLNGTSYRTLYFYDTVTGEEFSAPTLNVAYIPADFCGWVRIPFSMYVVPDWSMAYEWTDGVYDEQKEHTAIYITSQFILNDNVTMYFDNVGLYYSDFQVGGLFEKRFPGIAELMEGIA